MSDQDFHEIQLSGKQLIFLFMCVAVFTVVVFLFGVSVGRGVRTGGAQAAQVVPSAPPMENVPAAETPAPTAAAPAELSYAEALEGEDPSTMAPPPVPEEPAATTPEEPAPRSEAPPVQPEAKARPVAPVAPALSGWVVQVGAFSANDVAAREAAKLKGKGYPAFVFEEPPATPGPRFKVRVGPYSARADADRMLDTLTSEGYKPLLKR